MVTHLRMRSVFSCLTSVICPLTLTAFTFGSCLYCVSVSHYNDGWAVNFNIFLQRDIESPTWMLQLEHNTNMSQQWRQCLLISWNFGKTQLSCTKCRLRLETSSVCDTPRIKTSGSMGHCMHKIILASIVTPCCIWYHRHTLHVIGQLEQ